MLRRQIPTSKTNEAENEEMIDVPYDRQCMQKPDANVNPAKKTS